MKKQYEQPDVTKDHSTHFCHCKSPRDSRDTENPSNRRVRDENQLYKLGYEHLTLSQKKKKKKEMTKRHYILHLLSHLSRIYIKISKKNIKIQTWT